MLSDTIRNPEGPQIIVCCGSGGVGKIVGGQALADFAEFMKLWDDPLFDGFGRRAEVVKQLLAGDKTLFLAVATPQRLPMKEALYLYERLKENNMPFGGFIINRVQPADSHGGW